MSRGGNLNVMNKGQQYQCQICGALQWSKESFDIEGDLFVKMKCKHCHETTSHLWVGENETDVYEMYNVNADPRFYQYGKTIQND